MIEELIVCPSFLCNLSCPHCTLKVTEKDSKKRVEMLKNEGDIDAVIVTIKQVLKDNPQVKINLFGGEPFLLPDDYLEKLYDVLKDTFYSISTNLLMYNPDNELHIKLIEKAKWIDTSWNPKRFSTIEEVDWKHTCVPLVFKGIIVNLMITLTKDLITSYTPKEILSLISPIGFASVDFEYLIGEDEDVPSPESVDDFLCSLYDCWDESLKYGSPKTKVGYIKTEFGNVRNIRHTILAGKRYKNCDNIYTVLPTGELKHLCPFAIGVEINKFQCLSCKDYSYCGGGCILQHCCNLPKKLYERIKVELGK